MGQDVEDVSKLSQAAVMIQPRNRSSYFDQLNQLANNVFQEAVMRGDCAIVSVLLKYGIYARRNHRNIQGLTALQQAVFDGNMRLAVKLLEAGSDIEAKTANEWTALHIAAAVGEYEILCMLISNCADLLALTKNEELPIDLACNREIKVKLAKEMARVGYSELASWYMRKLAASEGAFYVVSADALLDIACYCDEGSDSPPSRSQFSTLQRSGSILVRDPLSSRGARHRNNSCSAPSTSSAPGTPASTGINLSLPNSKSYAWYQTPSTETMTYLSCSSGYLSEVIFNSTTGEYTQVEASPATSLVVSPKHTALTGASDLRLCKSLLSVSDDAESVDASQVRSNTLSRIPSSTRKNVEPQQVNTLQRKPSKIELFIDYSLDGDVEDDEVDGVNNRLLTYSSPMKMSVTDTGRTLKSPSTPGKSSLESYTKSGASHESSTTKSSVAYDPLMGLPNAQLDASSKASYESDGIASPSVHSPSKHARNVFSSNPGAGQTGNLPYDSRAVVRNNSFKNVRFTGDIDANEYCNCPNCKKMGYALSPDLRDSQKQDRMDDGSMLISKSFPTSNSELNGYPYSPSSKHAYGHADDYYSKRMNSQNPSGPGYGYWKPKKRKKNLLSGIMNIFKDTIKIQRSSSDTDISENDPGIVFAVALRDKLKTNAIKERSNFRRSNSFSGCVENELASSNVVRSTSFTTSNAAPSRPSFYDDDFDELDGDSYYVADTTYPVLPSTSQESPVSIHEVNRSAKAAQHTVDDSSRSGFSQSSSALQVGHGSLSHVGSAFENMRSLPYANYSSRSHIASGSHAQPSSSQADSYDTESLASDARISKLMSADTSSVVHGELDHDCDFCAAFAAVQGKGLHSVGSQRSMPPMSFFCSPPSSSTIASVFTNNVHL